MLRDRVVAFTNRPPAGDLADALRLLEAVLGKLSALVDVALLLTVAGHTVTNAAGGAGTAIAATRTKVDFADAGVDNVRVVVRAENSTVGSVVVAVHDLTNNVELCRVTVTGVAAGTYAGAWTVMTPTGIDQECELRVIGDGLMDPILYAVHLQGRSLRARP